MSFDVEGSVLFGFGSLLCWPRLASRWVAVVLEVQRDDKTIVKAIRSSRDPYLYRYLHSAVFSAFTYNFSVSSLVGRP